MQAVKIAAVIAIVEAAIAFVCLPWLPNHPSGIDALIFVSLYMIVFLGALAGCDWWVRRRKRGLSCRSRTGGSLGL